jgi:putative radical SAM enzyme (TIGR03279 family)
MSDYDFQQIVEMQLSPLYVSVHTTNPVLRQKMMRYKQEFDILARLKYLSDNDISLETQIVVVPGWNDGEELRKSLTDLSSPELKIESIGVVPVGLTKYRTGLTELKIVDAEEAEAIIAMSEEIKEQFGSDNIYCSDELFIKAGREIPPEDYYNGYPQIENGIGMIRLMLENWDMNRIEWMETFIAIQDQIVFVTAVLAAPYIQKIVDEINQHIPGKSRVAVIRNEFFGETVTVAGLLTWEDIISQVNLQTREVPILPSSIFSIDDLTIDNKKKEDFEAEWKREVVIIDSLLEIEDKEESFYEI